LIVSESGGTYFNRYPDEDWLDLALNQKSLDSIAFSSLISKHMRLQIMEMIKHV